MGRFSDLPMGTWLLEVERGFESRLSCVPCPSLQDRCLPKNQDSELWPWDLSPQALLVRYCDCWLSQPAQTVHAGPGPVLAPRRG